MGRKLGFHLSLNHPSLQLAFLTRGLLENDKVMQILSSTKPQLFGSRGDHTGFKSPRTYPQLQLLHPSSVVDDAHL